MDKKSLLDDFHTDVNHNICLATCLTGKTNVMETSTYNVHVHTTTFRMGKENESGTLLFDKVIRNELLFVLPDH